VPAVRQFEHQHNNVEFLRVVDQLLRLYQRLPQVTAAMEEQQEQQEDQEETSECCMTLQVVFNFVLCFNLIVDLSFGCLLARLFFFQNQVHLFHI
jgi:hypothetical protein